VVNNVEKGLLLVWGLASLLLLYILAPIIALYIATPLGEYSKLTRDPLIWREVTSALRVTLAASLIAVVFLAVLGVPLAYVLARGSFPGKSIIEAVVDIPLALPHTVAGIMLLEAYGSQSPMGELLERLGITIKDHLAGIVLVMMFVSAPLLVDTVKVGIQSIPGSLEEAAITLGVPRFRVFAGIILPLAWRSILAGAILAWARGLSEVGALLVVAYYPKTVNILILEYLSLYGLRLSAALAGLYAAITLAAFTALRMVAGK
jgi:molybdate/tungstate transport system permease protein